MKLDQTILEGFRDVLLIGCACFGFVRWNSPNWLRRAAVRMMARAEAIEARDQAHSDGLKHWAAKLETENGR